MTHLQPISKLNGDMLEQPLPGCERASMQLTCSILIIESYVTNFPVSVTVYDAHGGETSQELMLQIWNDGSYEASTESGLSLSYSMLYWGTSPFTLTATDCAAVSGVTLPGSTGSYDSLLANTLMFSSQRSTESSTWIPEP